MNTAHCKQTGVGIIEVMIALAVIMFAALVIASVQSNALISVRITETHFGVNEQAQEMLEMLRANKTEAQAGNYNVEFDNTISTDSDSSPVLVNIAAWKNQIGIQLPDGAGQIDCDITRRWSLLEMLRDKTEAQAGNYNVEFDNTISTDSDSSPVLVNIAAWKNQIGIQLPDGAGQIDCDITRCQVSIRWRENVDGSNTNRFYHIAGLN